MAGKMIVPANSITERIKTEFFKNMIKNILMSSIVFNFFNHSRVLLPAPWGVQCF